MRTNIVIDDKLMRDTLRTTGLKTRREAGELGLRTLLTLRKQASIRQLRGKLRALRTLGVTIRKTLDTIIATRCIEDGFRLLHNDRDFDRFARYLACASCNAASN